MIYDNTSVTIRLMIMEGKDCLRVKRVIPCENILSAKDPVNVIYQGLEDMNELFKSYEEKETEE